MNYMRFCLRGDNMEDEKFLIEEYKNGEVLIGDYFSITFSGMDKNEIKAIKEDYINQFENDAVKEINKIQTELFNLIAEEKNADLTEKFYKYKEFARKYFSYDSKW